MEYMSVVPDRGQPTTNTGRFIRAPVGVQASDRNAPISGHICANSFCAPVEVKNSRFSNAGAEHA
jgi:hypothetical protein